MSVLVTLLPGAIPSCVYNVTQDATIRAETMSCKPEDLASATATSVSVTASAVATSSKSGSQNPPTSSITSIASARNNSTNQATPATSSKGLAGGAVAGVAIGMLLAGALIAGLIFAFLLRRQKRKHAVSAVAHSRQDAAYRERSMGPEKGATVVTGAVGSIDSLLPQPVEDDAITGDLSKIRDNIKNHVRTYYHSGPVAAADLNEAGIRDVATLVGTNSTFLASALSNPSSRDDALRSIIASIILTRCTGERSPSLLPYELGSLISSISMSDGRSAAQTVLFSKWKSITGALLQQRFGAHSKDPSQAQSVQDAITSLDSVLAPFIKGSVDGGQRRKNLDMILTRAANLAFLLFAQPGSFAFDFVDAQGGLTVFPALVQTVGDQGQSLSPAKILAEKEVVVA